MSKRKAREMLEPEPEPEPDREPEPLLEFLCVGGQVYPLKPGQRPSMGQAVDSEEYFDIPNKRHKGVSFGVIEPGPESVALKVGAPLQTSHQSKQGQSLEAQGSQNSPIPIDSDSESESRPVARSSAPPEAEPTLCDEQRRVVDAIVEGHNVFYTGSAGCGKSTVLRAFVKRLRERGKMVRICAPTNLAALNVSGMTTWAFAGWTPGALRKPLEELERAANGRTVWRRLKETDVLVIDEISMCENLFFERLNAIMKEARESEEPFGGVQLVVTGDFCQLSPVKPFKYCIECGGVLKPDDEWSPTEYTCENPDCPRDLYYDRDKFAFRSQAWKECAFKHINLSEIHRQSDRDFIEILQSIRINNVISQKHQKVLLEHRSNVDGAIEIFARRNQVEDVNNRNIKRLPTEPRNFRCKDFFNFRDHHQHQYELHKKGNEGSDGTLEALEGHRYEPNVQLKKGMRVVLQHNLDPFAGLVNGSQGTIVDFEEFNSARLPRKGKDAENDFGYGVRMLGGAHARYAQEQIKLHAERNGYQPWPIVHFDNGQKRTVYADCMINEYGDSEPYSLLSRTQIPLMAGYAITVHKAQGMTLDKVKVDLSKAFDPSQIYVALSRARSLEGLQVTALPRYDLGGQNREVKEFFEKYLRE